MSFNWSKNFFTALILLLTGIAIGSALVGFFSSTKAAVTLKTISIVLTGVGIGFGVLLLIFRSVLHAHLQNWTPKRTSRILIALGAIVKDPVEANQHINDSREDFEYLGKIIVGAIASTRSLALMGMVLGIVLSIATLLTAYVQVELLNNQNVLVRVQNQLSESSRRAALSSELVSLLNDIPDNGELTVRLKARISSLSSALGPYKTLNGEGELIRTSSPERGRLLIELLAANVDITEILDTTNFTYADLSGARLYGPNLNGANLNDSNFNGAILRQTTMISAHLERADMRGSSLIGTDLSYSNLNEALLPSASTFSSALSIKGVTLNQAVTQESNWLYEVIHGWQGNRMRIDAVEKRNIENKEANSNRGSSPRDLHGDVLFEKFGVEKRFRYSMPRESLNGLLGWRQTENKIVPILEVDELDNFIFQNLRDGSIKGRKEKIRALADQIVDITNRTISFKLSKDFTVYGLPLRDELFQKLLSSGVVPRGSNFSYIAPGDVFSDPLKTFGVQLDQIDFSYSDLQFIDFSGSSLRESNLSGAILPQTSKLRGVDMSNTNIEDAIVTPGWLESVGIDTFKIRGIDIGEYELVELNKKICRNLMRSSRYQSESNEFYLGPYCPWKKIKMIIKN